MKGFCVVTSSTWSKYVGDYGSLVVHLDLLPIRSAAKVAVMKGSVSEEFDTLSFNEASRTLWFAQGWVHFAKERR